MNLTAGEESPIINCKSDLAFKPMLVKVEANYDLFQPDETLWLTCVWQNEGTEPSRKPLGGFLELSLGHQRIPELMPKDHRIYWEPFPSTNQWKCGEVWKTTIRCNLNFGWGGSYNIVVGLCDDNHLPVDIIGKDGKMVKQVKVGQIDVGWGWGTPTMDRERKPWIIVLNDMKPLAIMKPVDKSSLITFGDDLAIKLMKNVPIICDIGKVENNRSSSDMPPTVIIREYATDRLIYSTEPDMKIKYDITKIQNKGVIYHGVVRRKNQKLAEFNMKFESVGRQLQISLSEVKEQKGFELLEVKLPSLLSLSGDDASMVSFFGGGRLVSLKDAKPEGYIFNYDTRNAAALIKGETQLVMESTCLDDKLIEAVQENDKVRTANLGMILINRVQGKGKVKSIPVENDHKIIIELLDRSWGEPGWQTIAKYLRRNLVKGKYSELYRNKLLYKILATSGPEPPTGFIKEDSPYGVKRLSSVIKFKEIEDMIRKTSNILDSMPQIVYIGGFQEGGFDNSYPFVYNTDQRVGTVEELKKCIADGKKYNAIVGLHDNYDDMELTKYYDKRIVSLDDEGTPWKGWFWSAGLSYIISPYKYAMLGLMQERVKKTVELYGLNTSYHLDVLSSEVLRYDFDPKFSASADKSYKKGELKIIDEFNKYGIDITSETLTQPFVGHIGFALWPKEDRYSVLFKGDQYIPLVPFVYHGTIGYCGSGTTEKEILWNLIMGKEYYPSEDIAFTDKDIMAIYIQEIPVEMFYDKKMVRFEKDGGKMEISYDDQSYIKVNFKDTTYEVICDGQLIGKDWTTFVPGFNKGTYLAYSKNGGKFDYPVPPLFSKSKKLHAVTLTSEGEGNVLSCEIINGHVIMDMPQGVPVKITNDQ
jgi:hypothetical protein